ncbi:MAG: hypothetical protein RIS90_1935 [Pseudomonadota bacterium]
MAPPASRLKPKVRRPRWTWIDTTLVLVFALLLALLLWRAGGVFSYKWNWSTVWPFVYRFDEATKSWVPNLLAEGLAMTLRLALWGIVLATIIGIVMGFARVSKRLVFRLIGTAYVMVIRNVPPVVFVFVFVFFIASQIMPALALGDRLRALSPTAQWWLSILFGTPKLYDNFFLGLICLSVFSGAYVTEIVRAGLQSVPKAQIEAGNSLGMTPGDVTRFVVLPQALRNVLPPMAGQLIQLIKDSSLISLVSIQELTFMAQDVQISTQRVFEVFLFVGGIYFVICFTLSQVFSALERRFALAHK